MGDGADRRVLAIVAGLFVFGIGMLVLASLDSTSSSNSGLDYAVGLISWAVALAVLVQRREGFGDHWRSRPAHTPITVALFVGALVLVAGALFALAIAIAVRYGSCDGTCSVRPESDVQFGLAIFGFVLVLATAVQVAWRSWRSAAILLVLSIATFAAWAVFLDTATHGWGKGPIPF